MSDDIKTVDLSDHATLMDCYKKLSKSHADLRAELAAERERREFAVRLGEEFADSRDTAEANVAKLREVLAEAVQWLRCSDLPCEMTISRIDAVLEETGGGHGGG